MNDRKSAPFTARRFQAVNGALPVLLAFSGLEARFSALKWHKELKMYFHPVFFGPDVFLFPGGLGAEEHRTFFLCFRVSFPQMAKGA